MKTVKIAYHTVSILVVGFVLLQFGPSLSKPRKVEVAELPNTLETQWKNLRKSNLVSGTLLITKGDQVLFSDGDLHEVYPIASLSKSVVGYAFFELQRQGKLDLDQNVCVWMKNFCESPFNEITLRHLLNHRAGFGRDLSFVSFLKRTFAASWELKTLDSIHLEPSDLDFQPGQGFAYSNFGYLILSRVLEVIEKQEFEKIVSDLAEHNGLIEFGATTLQDSFSTEVLVPYTDLSASISLSKESRNSAGAGGLKASASALIKWLTILEKNEIPYLVTSNAKDSYQLGLVKSKKQTFQAYWHNGASPGTYSLMVTIPEQSLKIVLLTKNLKFIKVWSDSIEQFEKYFN